MLGNTESASKLNFWDYAQSLFHLSAPLPRNIGLAGKGLSGLMDPQGGHFFAEGIPLTADFDNGARSPFQLAEVVVRNSAGTVLASTQTVVPVSTEINCDNCHNNYGRANPGIGTGVVKQNILTLHDQHGGTHLMQSRPVLCAGCHSDNALQAPGRPGIPSLSRAMHSRHARIDDGTMTGTCYQCHPGPETQCLRGAMYRAGKDCYDCHGGMAAVANPGRRPWIDEPRCAKCHRAPYQENSGKLYRFSVGHHNIMCQACHGSQHAVYTTTQPLDSRQSLLLQGSAGTINHCGVCHTNRTGRTGDPHTEGDDDD